MRALFPKLTGMALVALLSACVATAPAKDAAKGPNPVTGDAIEVTALDGASAKPGKPEQVKPAAPVPTPNPELAGKRPQKRPDDASAKTALPVKKPADEAAPVPAESTPEATKTPAQLACEKRGSIWAKLGDTGAFYCAKRTKDNGKLCSKGTECEGDCLARSGTCAPFMPLLGCNDILQDDGRRMTLCID